MSDSNFLVSKASICSGTPRASENALLPRTPPNCARCKNHGLKITLKGHKRYCKYRCCNCEKCRLTSDRQKIMALQTSWRRAQAQDEARALLMGEVPPSVPVNSFLSHHNKLHQTKISPSKYLASEQCKTPHVNTLVIQPSHEGSCDSSSLPSSTSNTASSLLAKKQTLICANSAHMPFVAECREKWRNLRTEAMQFSVPYVKTLLPSSTGNLPEILQDGTTVTDENTDTSETEADILPEQSQRPPTPPPLPAQPILSTEKSAPIKNKLKLNNKSAIEADNSVVEDFKAKKARMEASLSTTTSCNSERKEALKTFLFSLIPEIKHFNDEQRQLFQRQMFNIIDDISSRSTISISSSSSATSASNSFEFCTSNESESVFQSL